MKMVASLFAGVAGFPVNRFEILVLEVGLVVRRAVAHVSFHFKLS